MGSLALSWGIKKSNGYLSNFVGRGGRDWMNEASCAGVDPRVFDPDTIDYDPHRAKSICAGCPVLSTCSAEAEPTDFQYTFRAGKDPAGAGRGIGDRACKRGHVGHYDSAGRACLACKREFSAAERRSAGIPRRIQVSRCKNGHDDWVTVGASKKRRCKTCANAREVRRRAKAKDVIMNP